MATVLVTRAADDAARTAARLAELGHRPIVSPLLVPEPIAWDLPAHEPDALLITSARAIALAGPKLASLRHLPLYVFGDRTAAAAHSAGFSDLRKRPCASVSQLLPLIRFEHDRADPMRLLHLTGELHACTDCDPALSVDIKATYRVALTCLSPEALESLMKFRLDWVLLFSPATARHFRHLCERSAIDGAQHSISAISQATLVEAGSGWRRTAVAERPSLENVLIAAGLSDGRDGPAPERLQEYERG